MATSPQKSPSVPKSPTPKSPPSRKKDDSFLGKLGGTLARRKKAKEDVSSRLALPRSTNLTCVCQPKVPCIRLLPQTLTTQALPRPGDRKLGARFALV
ncbi:hypothetical protein MC885_010080 [Smutsia gigantea]|nr:hypothetical protein MC885_010080 [Smutsia gigantea]